MSEPYFSWRQHGPRELAQFVQTDLPDAFKLSNDLNRLDTLRTRGPAELIKQLYTVLLKKAINYDFAPFDARAGVVQQIRKPQTILGENRGTCLDLTLVLAGMCLANDLLPMVIVLVDHALLAVSLTNTRQNAEQASGSYTFVDGMLTDLRLLQEWASDGAKYLFIECTGVAKSQGGLSPVMPEGLGRNNLGIMSFERACRAGAQQLERYTHVKDSIPAANQRAFLYALHIHDLQVKYGFAPLKDSEKHPEASSSSTTQIFRDNDIAVAGNVGRITYIK